MTATEAFERVFAFDNERYVRRKGFSVTANLFCSRALFNRVGGFRVGVSEDTEWSHRALGIGARLAYAPRAVVGHPARRTWAELIGKWRRMSAERYALVKVGPAGRLRWFVRSCALPASAIIHTLRVLTTSRLVTVSQRLGALGVLYRLRFWRAGDAWRLLAADGALDGQVNGRLGPDGSDSV